MKRDGLILEPRATFAEALGMRVWARALAGDLGAAKEIREATEGKTGPRIIPQNKPEKILVEFGQSLGHGPVSVDVPGSSGLPGEDLPGSVPDKSSE
jgi:hypothetical protein